MSWSTTVHLPAARPTLGTVASRLLVAVSAVLLAGCGSIEQVVKPVAISNDDPREICVIENSSVRKNFSDEYVAALSERGFKVRMLPAGASVAECPLTSTYTANWRWDLALYMAYANIKVYRSGQLQGEALYDSLRAGASTSKFINASQKIRELTAQLFPR